MKYQIYCDRGNGLELDGCWGSEHAKFSNKPEAIEASKHLAKNYPDCAWVVVRESDKSEIDRIGDWQKQVRGYLAEIPDGEAQ